MAIIHIPDGLVLPYAGVIQGRLRVGLIGRRPIDGALFKDSGGIGVLAPQSLSVCRILTRAGGADAKCSAPRHLRSIIHYERGVADVAERGLVRQIHIGQFKCVAISSRCVQQHGGNRCCIAEIISSVRGDREGALCG